MTMSDHEESFNDNNGSREVKEWLGKIDDKTSCHEGTRYTRALQDEAEDEDRGRRGGVF